jgi:hypothetical protein
MPRQETRLSKTALRRPRASGAQLLQLCALGLGLLQDGDVEVVENTGLLPLRFPVFGRTSCTWNLLRP